MKRSSSQQLVAVVVVRHQSPLWTCPEKIGSFLHDTAVVGSGCEEAEAEGRQDAGAPRL